VVLATDALCSASDETHDALLTLYQQRFSEQIETADSEEIVAAWRYLWSSLPAGPSRRASVPQGRDKLEQYLVAIPDPESDATLSPRMRRLVEEIYEPNGASWIGLSSSDS